MSWTADLRHYTADPLAFDRRRWYDGRATQSPGMKPCGFWISDGDAWAEWCSEAEFDERGLAHCSRVTLVADANVLHIGTTAEFLDFTTRYAHAELNDRVAVGVAYIDWPVVASTYDGIMITPYRNDCHFLRPETFWYYGWDVASGCVWNLAAIDAVEPLELGVTP